MVFRDFMKIIANLDYFSMFFIVHLKRFFYGTIYESTSSYYINYFKISIFISNCSLFLKYVIKISKFNNFQTLIWTFRFKIFCDTWHMYRKIFSWIIRLKHLSYKYRITFKVKSSVENKILNVIIFSKKGLKCKFDYEGKS